RGSRFLQPGGDPGGAALLRPARPAAGPVGGDGPAHAQGPRPAGAGHPDGPRLRHRAVHAGGRQRPYGLGRRVRGGQATGGLADQGARRVAGGHRAARRVHRRRRHPGARRNAGAAGRDRPGRPQPGRRRRAGRVRAGGRDQRAARRADPAAGLRRGRRRARPVGGHGAAGAHRRVRLHRPGAAEEQPAGDRGRARRRHRRQLTGAGTGGGRRPGATVFLLTALGTVSYVTGRLGITDVSPVVSCGRYPARAVVGEHLPVAATVFREGHDAVAANVAWRGPDGSQGPAGPLIRMVPGVPGTDRWHATVVPTDEGAWTFAIEAWGDPVATWRHKVEVKIDAGQGPEDLANDLEDGARLLQRALRNVPSDRRRVLEAAAEALRDTNRDLAHRVGPALTAEVTALLDEHPVRELLTRSPRYTVWVDRKKALFSSWYELFPRSEGAEIDADGTPRRHGTFKDAARRLPQIAQLGFDVVYLPPIHPIGKVNRKGRNNTLMPGPEDVGSPWAIGSDEGGHDAIHPQLGTFEDFDDFVAATREHGMEVALDLALQAAPDHPWVTEHPEWFTTRPDGSIAYAENPPKKYQDIYPLNFDNDPKGIYAEVLRIVRLWVGHGVKIFRVDNPHTKPLNFWHWLIWEVKKTDPDVVFLAEAFTRPAMMHTLAKIGFTQSYTYFTWRTAKCELEEYGRELVAAADYM